MREKDDRNEDEERVREKDDRKEDEERVREKDDRKEDEERVIEEDKGKGGEVGMEKKANDTRVCCMLTCFKSLCNTYFWFILIVVLSE